MTIVKFQRGIIPKVYRQELRFLWSVRHLMMLYISMKFHENILNGFQVIEWTQLHGKRTDRQTSEAKTICLHPCQGET